MFSNLSASIDNDQICYPILDSTLPFCDYIAKTRAIIEYRRSDTSHLIIEANSPFELYPEKPILSGKQLKYGVLLIHGLLDSPFSLRDIGIQLQANGILSRAILLPGHGTTASDLLTISYHDWIQAVRYGIESLRQEVEQIFLIGYSTGATLSIYHALQDAHINGIILLSPAIKIKAPVNLAVAWHKLSKWMSKDHHQWMYQEKEIDYAKYQSITFNSIRQVALLTNVIRELRTQRPPLTNPIFMVVSREDETISSHHAINFFSNLPNQESRLLLYTSIDHRYPDPRIITRLTAADLFIKHCSHISIPFAPSNQHYGVNGDYIHASRLQPDEIIYGAYNRIEEKFFDALHLLSLTKLKRRALTYNPDFNNMTKEIVQFILK